MRILKDQGHLMTQRNLYLLCHWFKNLSNKSMQVVVEAVEVEGMEVGEDIMEDTEAEESNMKVKEDNMEDTEEARGQHRSRMTQEGYYGGSTGYGAVGERHN